MSFLGNRDALQEYELMGYLNHDTGTVARLVVGALGTAVLHVLQHPQRLIHQFVALAAMDICDHSHTAGVVLHVVSV